MNGGLHRTGPTTRRAASTCANRAHHQAYDPQKSVKTIYHGQSLESLD